MPVTQLAYSAGTSSSSPTILERAVRAERAMV
jgi:hypothetical protein